MSKKWFLSKTIWINALMIAGSFFSPLDADAQLKILAVVNIVLRWITKEAVEW